MFHIRLTPDQLRRFQRTADGTATIDREMFVKGIKEVLQNVN